MYSYTSSVDAELLADKGRQIDIENLDINEEKGYFLLNYRGIAWSILYMPGKRDKMVVSLSGGGDRGNRPTFNRWKFNDVFDCTQICIEDPMYSLYGVPTGWFFGNEKEDYCVYVAEIIDIIRRQLGIKNLIFYSSSAGATANIRVANILKYGYVVALCPQTDISKHYPEAVDAIEKVIGTDLQNDPLRRNASILDNIRDDSSVKYIFMENLSSNKDLIYANLIAQKYDKKLEVGANYVTDNLLVWAYEADDGKYAHLCMDWRAIVPCLMHAFNEYWNDGRIPDSEVAFLNLLIHDRYAEIKKYNEKHEKANVCVWDTNICFEVGEAVLKHITKMNDIVLERKSSRYNYFRYNLEKNKLYSAEFMCQSEDVDEFSVVIYDFRSDKVLYQRTCKIDQVGEISFITGENFENKDVSFLIYSGIRGKTEMKALKVTYLSISEADNT
ncbi:MAG: hypothetical protein K6G75_00555 [Lachnospiraceae bacterium]|nr:hypothetical protein [Lachnospiraceae bacterium]